MGAAPLGTSGNTGMGASLFRYPAAFFAKKTDNKKLKEEEDKESTPSLKKKRASAKKETETPEAPASGRKTRKSKTNVSAAEEEGNAKTEIESKTAPDEKANLPAVHRLYTLKFNSPILPFAKFPLTQNKYI